MCVGLCGLLDVWAGLCGLLDVWVGLCGLLDVWVGLCGLLDVCVVCVSQSGCKDGGCESVHMSVLQT